MHPKNLLIEDFNYNLPDERIAKHPVQKRDESKLLIWKNEKIKEDKFYNLDKYLPENSLVIFNNTKVVEARLLFQKKSGTTIEIFCLEPADVYADITTAMLQTKNVLWKCLVGNAKKWKDELLEKKIQQDVKEIVLTAKKIRKQSEDFIIEFFWNNDTLSFAEVLHLAGVIPLPPYLHRDAEKEDAVRYQTIYARNDGSVAAPTAGLHFTDNVFEKLSAKQIEKDFVTLHVGAGTFKPVKTETIEQHEMHSEFFEVSKEFISRLLNSLNKEIVAVGTTSLRTIESLFWIGRKVLDLVFANTDFSLITPEMISLSQWEAYELNSHCSAETALEFLLLWMDENKLDKLIAKTQILIAPPYKLKIADALITNFHQPKSTLLLLVAAIVGDKWKSIYDYALQNNFRFLSYGDACLLMP